MGASPLEEARRLARCRCPVASKWYINVDSLVLHYERALWRVKDRHTERKCVRASRTTIRIHNGVHDVKTQSGFSFTELSASFF